MEIVNFTPGSALLGGAVIGLAVSVFLLTTGRVAGISGVVGGVVCPAPRDVGWRAAFIAGLLVVGMLAALMTPASVTWDLARSPAVMAVAGLLVGFGTRLGNGCTSGHGVCGLSRLSGRSLAATITFISAGIVTVGTRRQAGMYRDCVASGEPCFFANSSKPKRRPTRTCSRTSRPAMRS